MSDSTQCPRCGSELPANFPPGVCPACLLKQGLSPSTLHGEGGPGNGNRGSGRQRSWNPPTPAELAPHFPQLEIVELLGQGGMGAVYKVRQKELDRWAALKVLPGDVARDPNFAERFQREARALALLGHQNIVIVYEFGQRDGVYFLLMEYIDGVTLRQAIRAGQVSDKETLSIITQICDALQFAHEEGVVHRDIKPENILIDKRGRVKIADFGLAKLLGQTFEVPTLTGTHQVMGTPVYMAPEQMEGTRGVDHRADIFSLGVVFYELLTGELPLGRFAPPSQKYQLDVRLDDVVLRSLEKEPDRRYQKASDVKYDVDSIRSQPQITHPTATAVQPKPLTKLRWANRAAGVVIVLLVAVMMFMLSMILQNPRLNFVVPGGSGISFSQPKFVNPNPVTSVKKVQPPAAAGQLVPSAHPMGGMYSAQERQASLDANAIVQFTSEGPKLNPGFERSGYSEIDRQKLNKILAKIHTAYLSLEKQHTTWTKNDDGSQVSIISKFEAAASSLENDLWTEIDNELTVAQQNILRLNMPVYSDDSQRGTAKKMEGGNRSPANRRLIQLLGFRQEDLPIQITIGRQGKWYRWSIAKAFRTELSGPDGTMGVHWTFPQVVDSDEAPELPSGLLRFWRTEISTNEPGQADTQQEKQALITSVEPLRNNDPYTVDGLLPNGKNPADSNDRIPENEDAARDKGVAQPIPNVEPDHEKRTLDSEPPAESQGAPASPTRENVAPQKSLNDELGEFHWRLITKVEDWDAIKNRTDELLKQYKQPNERILIHEAVIDLAKRSSAQSESVDLADHYKELLKYARDPFERAKLHIASGDIWANRAVKTPASFAENRAEATRWYLRGYAELLLFDLPKERPKSFAFALAPLPAVNYPLNEDGTPTKEQIDDEVRRAAESIQERREAFIKQLFQFRDSYFEKLMKLYGPLHELHDWKADPNERFRTIAIEILFSQHKVDKLMDSMGLNTGVSPTLHIGPRQ